MKKLIFTILFIALGATIFSGCSTKRYGRLQSVTEKEAEYLTCQQIEIEIDKADNFIKTVNQKKSKFTKEDFLALFGDLGIGNRMEVSEAIKSAKNRIRELKMVQSEKGCY